MNIQELADVAFDNSNVLYLLRESAVEKEAWKQRPELTWSSNSIALTYLVEHGLVVATPRTTGSNVMVVTVRRTPAGDEAWSLLEVHRALVHDVP